MKWEVIGLMKEEKQTLYKLVDTELAALESLIKIKRDMDENYQAEAEEKGRLKIIKAKLED